MDNDEAKTHPPPRLSLCCVVFCVTFSFPLVSSLSKEKEKEKKFPLLLIVAIVDNEENAAEKKKKKLVLRERMERNGMEIGQPRNLETGSVLF